MRLHLFVAPILASVLFIIASVSLAHAQWSAIKSTGYAVTTNWHGEDVPLGQPVTAWAGTTNPEVEKAEFKWRDPVGNLAWDVNITVFGPYETPEVPPNAPQEVNDWAEKYPGYAVWYADTTKTPENLGDWSVQVSFYNSGNLQGQKSTIVAIRGTSTNTIPEIPFGTIATILIILAGFGFVASRNRKMRRSF